MTPKKTPPKRSNGAAKKETAKAEPKKSSPKARVRKAPAVPVAEPAPHALSEEEIAREAYYLWESRGKPMGSPEEDWHKAKEQLRTPRQ